MLCMSRRGWKRTSLTTGILTATPFPTQNIGLLRKFTGPCGVISGGGARGLTPVFATGRAVSRIPLSTRQLKQKEQALVQTSDQSGVIQEESLKDTEGAEKRLKRLKEWRVVLHNDDIHTFECVETAITKVLPHISRARAYDIALHAHTNRQATIILTWKEKASEVATALQDEGLTVSILPEKIFTEDA
ncbi:uncharacterized protein LOC113147107 [Cyclospora cayetanensis]|uniref:Uncharacterized protein LOC113147107 n=1 Tax=Cyclospora cayetanensis TaxID=88456 RepID=A0A6P6RYQ7_9EIME|nr:uncharacterized protein LOC113147107 [Cyclospora cayetanensis]